MKKGAHNEESNDYIKEILVKSFKTMLVFCQIVLINEKTHNLPLLIRTSISQRSSSIFILGIFILQF